MKHPRTILALAALNVFLAFGAQPGSLVAEDDGPGSDNCGACYEGLYGGTIAHSDSDWGLGATFEDVVNGMNWTHGAQGGLCWDHSTHTQCCIED